MGGNATTWASLRNYCIRIIAWERLIDGIEGFMVQKNTTTEVYLLRLQVELGVKPNQSECINFPHLLILWHENFGIMKTLIGRKGICENCVSMNIPALFMLCGLIWRIGFSQIIVLHFLACLTVMVEYYSHNVF